MILRLFKLINEEHFDCLTTAGENTLNNILRLRENPNYLEERTYKNNPNQEKSKQWMAYWSLLNRKYKIVK